MNKNPFPHLVFVYGTLQQGSYNNPVMTGHQQKDARLVGPATTLQKFFMADGGFPRVSTQVTGSFPVSERATSYFGQIRGELWELNDSAFKACDRLESHPTFYRRAEVPVTLNGTRKRHVAWIYLIVEPFPAYQAMQKNRDGVLAWTSGSWTNKEVL